MTAKFPPGYRDFSCDERPKEIVLKEKPRGVLSYLGGLASSVLSKAANTSVGQSVIFASAGLAVKTITTFKLHKSDGKVLKESQTALEKLGLIGPKAMDLKKTIDGITKGIIEDPKLDPRIKKLIDTSKDEIETVKQTLETVVTTAIANLAKLVQARKASSGIAYVPQSSSELMQDILLYFAEKATIGGKSHFLNEQIAKIESSTLSDASKKEKYAEVFDPLTKAMVSTAFPKGLRGAGLGLCARGGGKILLGYLPSILASYYSKSFETGVESNNRKSEIAKTEEGELLIQAVEFGVRQAIGANPLLKSLGAFFGSRISALATKLAFNLSGGDKTNPLQSALKKITELLSEFYLTQATALKKSLLQQIQLKEELSTCEASVVPADQIPAKNADLSRLKEAIAKIAAERSKLFAPIVKKLWDTLGLEKEKIVDTFLSKDGQKKLVEETLPETLRKACDSAITENPGVLKWIAPDACEMQKEIDALNLGSSVEPIAQALSQLLLAPAPGMVSGMSPTISENVIKLINSILPLSKGVKEQITKSLVEKLQSLAKNPTNTDPLWQFLQTNIKGLALDIVKSLAGNPHQADLIRALSTLPSGGHMQDVIDILRKIVADLKGDVESFQKVHGAAIAKTFASLSNPPTKEELQNFHELFKPLSEQLLKQTCLDKLFAKNERLGVFGLDKEIQKQLLSVCADLYNKMTQPAPLTPPQPAAVAVPPQPAMNPKERMELLGNVVEIIGKHFNGLGDPLHPTRSFAERIAAIESAPTDDVAKKREITELFRPMVEELNKDKKLVDFITTLVSSKVTNPIFSSALGALGKDLVPMFPSVLAYLYPVLAGSSGDSAIRKNLLKQSDEGKVILAAIDFGTKKLLTPLLDSLLKQLSGDNKKDFTQDPLLKHLEGFGNYLADSILSSFFLNLAGHDTDNPLKALLSNLQELIGNLYKDNLVPLKTLYQQQIATQQLLKNCPAANQVEINRLNDLLKDLQKDKLELMKPIVDALWKAGEFEDIPPFHLIPNMALELISGQLCEAFDKLIESQPGILSWIEPDKSNDETRKELALVENSEICTALAGVAGPLALTPAKTLLVDPKTTDGIATAAVKEITSALPLTDDLKECLKQVISTHLQDLAQQNPLWDFIQSNIEGLVLDLFNNMSIKQASLGKAIFKLASGSNIKDGYNSLETLAEELIEQAYLFKKNHGDALEQNYAKELTAIRKARTDLANARAALPNPPTAADLAILETQKDALEAMETTFYDRFQPLADGLINSIGFDKLLEKESRLGIFGLDKLIRKQLLVLCAYVYQQAINPLNEKTHINHNLGIALFDPNYAAKIAQGNDDKADKLRKVGIKLDGADLARQKTILEASGASTSAEIAENMGAMLAGIIERETKKYLMEAGDDMVDELNNEILLGKLSDPVAFKLFANGIQNLSKANRDGTKGFFQYLHTILVPALSKAMNNIITSTTETVPSLPGEHAKQSLPTNVILRLFENMHKDITEMESTGALQPLREEIWKKEDLIKQQKVEIEKAKAANLIGGSINVQALETDLEKAQKELNALFSKFGQNFQPLVKKLLSIASAKSKNIHDTAHPLHDASILPVKTRNALWETVIPTCMGIYIGSHYHKMKPRTEALEEQLRTLVGNNKLNEFCHYMGVVVRDSTPDSLTKEPEVLASDLSGTILDTFKKFEQTAPDYIKKLHALLNTHEGSLKHFLECFFKSVGASKLEIFTEKLWPALQQYSYPVILQMVYKVTSKLKQHDSAPVRTKLAIDFMTLLNTHAKTSNAAANATKYSHPHEVPVGKMFDQFKKAGQLHPVIDSVMKSTPEQEAAIRKQYFTDYAKEFFATIGFTKDDLPLEEAEKEGTFKLFTEELAPLVIGITFDSMAPGKTRNSVEGDLYNACIKIMLEEYQKRSDAAKEKAQITGDRSSLRETLPEIAALLAKKSKPTKEDADQAKLDEELGNLVVNELRNRIPDAIAHEQLVIRPLLAASAKDLGAIIREKWCEKDGSLVELLSWMGMHTLQALFKGKYDERLDKFVPEQSLPTFHPTSATPEKVKKTSLEAHGIATKVASDLIAGSLEEWFNGVLESIARTFNAALVDLYQLIDKICKSKKYSDAIIRGIKNAVWYIGWGLFYATILPWVISLIAKHAYLPYRVGANVSNIQKELHSAYNRNFFYHTADRLLDRPLKPAVVA